VGSDPHPVTVHLAAGVGAGAASLVRAWTGTGSGMPTNNTGPESDYPGDAPGSSGRYSAFDDLIEGCQVISPDWRYLYLNDAAARHGRISTRALVGRTMMDAYPGIDRIPLFEVLKRCMENREHDQIENEFTYPDGSTGWFELRISPVPEGLFILSLDITQRKNAEDRIKHLNNMLRAIRNINQLITRQHNPGDLLQEACKCLVEVRGFAGALAGLTAGPDRTRAFAQSGVGSAMPQLQALLEGGGLPPCALQAQREASTVVHSADDEICSRCPARTDIPEGHGVMATPLLAAGTPIGVLTVFVPETYAWDEEERALLQEVADDMGFALHAIEGQRRERRKTADIEYLARSAQEFLALPPDTDLFAHIAGQLKSLAGDVIVLVNSIDPQRKVMECRAEAGLGSFTQGALRLLGQHPVGMTFPFDEAAERELLEGTLKEVKGGLRELTFGRVPEAVCTALERLLGIKGIVSIGFATQGRLFANATLVLRSEPTLHNERTIEAFVAQAATALLQRSTQEGLYESDARYRSLFAKSLDAVYVHDFDGRFMDANPAALALLGYSKPEIRQLSFTDLLDTPQLDRAASILEEIRTRGAQRRPSLFRLRCKDGTVIEVETMGSVLVRDEKAVAVQGIARDITARREAERKLADAEEQLRQSQKLEAIGRLAGGVAHDFNNMLAAIIGYTDVMLREVRKDDPFHVDLTQIRTSATRAADLTRQLLAFSRKQVLEPRVLDPADVVKGIEKMLRRLIGEDIDLRVALPHTPWRMKADPGQVEQVIMNLAVNARDAMPQGGKLTIEVENVTLDEGYAHRHVEIAPGDYVMMAVSDSGHGMSEDVKEHLFEPFFTTKAQGKGTGLGLSTVYGIVKQSGGHVAVYSEEGHGTTFKVYFPRTEAKADSVRASGSRRALARGTETVLVAEDEEVLRRLTVRILCALGYSVLEAANGGEALLICQNNPTPIDLLVTDVVMPGMSGRRLAERLAETKPAMKVLFTSGYTDDAIAHHGVLEPGTPFIQKPFSASELALKMRELLDARDDG